MRLSGILNQCRPIPGFVYGQASCHENEQTILVAVRPRKRSAAICSGCHQTAPGYDQSRTPRRFEFIGFWGYLVFLVYCLRRVDCPRRGVLVEEVPWGMGQHTATTVSMRFLGHGARKLSWKETAQELSHLLGQGARRGSVSGRPGVGTSRPGPDSRHWRGRDSIRQRP